MENSKELLRKLKIRYHMIPLPGTHPEKNTVWKDVRTLMFREALLTIAKSWRTRKWPSLVLAWRSPGRGARWAALDAAAQSRTRPAWLSSSSTKRPKCLSKDGGVCVCGIYNTDNGMLYVYIMEYYPVKRQNEIISFAATEIILLSEVSQRKANVS